MGRKLLDLKGQVFTYLTAMEFLGRQSHSSLWRCQCKCGSFINVQRGALVGGTVKSCGCFRIERMEKLKRTHGMAGHKRDGSTKKSPEYKVWDALKDRCLNPRNKNFHNYGGAGVGVCAEWQNSFENFFAHVGARPSANHSLDRWPDKWGDYKPGNVRWATPKEQGRNKRNNVMVTYGGVVMCLAEAAEIAGIPYHIMKNRIYKGWSKEDALGTPVDMRKSNAGRRT